MCNELNTVFAKIMHNVCNDFIAKYQITDSHDLYLDLMRLIIFSFFESEVGDYAISCNGTDSTDLFKDIVNNRADYLNSIVVGFVNSAKRYYLDYVRLVSDSSDKYDERLSKILDSVCPVDKVI